MLTNSHPSVPDSNTEKHFMDRLSGERCGQDILWPSSWSCWATQIGVHAHIQTHTHTQDPGRQVSLCCVGMNPSQHLCFTVRDPYICHPEGGQERRKPARARQREKIKLSLCFSPCAPFCSSTVVPHQQRETCIFYTAKLRKMELFLSNDVWPLRSFPVLMSLYGSPCSPEWKTCLSIKRPSTMKGQNVGRKKGLTFKESGLL